MNPFCTVARAEAEAQCRYMAYKDALAARPLTLAVVWDARRAWERAEQRQRQARTRLDRWRRLRYERLGPALPVVEAGKRRVSWRVLDKGLGDLDARAEGIGPWMLATQRLSLACRQAGDYWSFYVVAAIRLALQCPSDLQGELLRLPMEQLVRLVRSLSLWGNTLEQATAALACWPRSGGWSVRRSARKTRLPNGGLVWSSWRLIEHLGWVPIKRSGSLIAAACRVRPLGALAAASTAAWVHCR